MSAQSLFDIYLDGAILDEASARNLAGMYQSLPEEAALQAVIQLVGYSQGRARSPSSRAVANEALLWLFEHLPQYDLEAFDLVDVHAAPELISRIVVINSALLNSHPHTIEVVRNAMKRIALADIGQAVRAAERLLALVPNDLQALEILASAAQKCAFRAVDQETRTRHAMMAVQALSRLLMSAESVDERCGYWVAGALAFWTSNELDAARLRALTFLLVCPADSVRGRFLAHTVLGLIALSNNDVVLSKQHASSAAASIGNAKLRHEALEIILFEELYRRGEVGFVADLLRTCARSTDDRSIQELVSDLERGDSLRFPEPGRFP